MLVNWNLLVSAVKLVNFERVACSFVGVTCSFDAITFRFAIPKWWILQHIYRGGNSVEKVGGGRAKLCEFPTSLFWFCTFFILILYWSNCLIRCVCKKSFLSYPYFSMVIKKYAKSKQICRKFAKLCPPYLFNWISATVYVLPYSSFWNHKTKSYGIKTTSYGIKTTSYAHKTTSYAFKIYKFDSWH